jgi:hypothetical protein
MNKLRFALAATMLAIGVAATDSNPVSADVSDYCGHGTSRNYTWLTEFNYEYTRPRTSFPYLETVHVYNVYRQSGKRGTGWTLDHIEIRICHVP